jgi:hypothetical protein
MLNKENLLYFFLTGKIKLSQYDYKFMANLQGMIHQSNRVTSGQAGLFDTLIGKYARQLSKHGLNKDELTRLEWKAEYLESTPEYTGAVLSMQNNMLTMRVPFNKNFIAKFKDIYDNPFKWDREEKIYKTNFSTRAFKMAYMASAKYFPTVQYCDQLTALLDKINQYAAPIWDPTLVQVHGHFLIAASNEYLDEAIKDIQLNDEPIILFTLSKYGIKTHPALCEGSTKKTFAANRLVEVRIEDLDTLISYCDELGCPNFILGHGLRRVSNSKVQTAIGKHNQSPSRLRAATTTSSDWAIPQGDTLDRILLQMTSGTVPTSFGGSIAKIVKLTDSTPIEVK